MAQVTEPLSISVALIFNFGGVKMLIEIVSKETGTVVARETNPVTAKELAEILGGICVTRTV